MFTVTTTRTLGCACMLPGVGHGTASRPLESQGLRMHSDTIIIARWHRFWRQCCIAYRKGATEDLEGELSRKADALSVRGIWLGHTDDSDEHIIMTPEGVITARTIVRLEPDKRADRDLLMNCKGVCHGAPVPLWESHWGRGRR